MATVKNTMVKSGNVSIPVRIYRPRASGPLPTIVYYHGGAWFVGGVEGSDLSSRQLANDAKAIVVSVEYRMAPENPYPASWDDDKSAFEWVVGEAKNLGGAPDTVCVAGHSAGGNMPIVVTTAQLTTGKARALCRIHYFPAVDHNPVATKTRTNNTP